MNAAVAQQPYRVVDAGNQGWVTVPDGQEGLLYAADNGPERGLGDRSYEQLAETRGPLRPVEPIAGGDEAELRRQFTAAGRRAVTSLAAALDTVFHELRQAYGGEAAPGSYQDARRTLLAGHEGSFESQVLMSVVLFGTDLNLARPTPQLRDPGARRAAGPSRRVDPAVRSALAGILHRWVSDSRRFTEVAGTLAHTVSAYCDETAGAGGWRAVADQWLQPGSLARKPFSDCYRLLYSLSGHYDPSLL